MFLFERINIFKELIEDLKRVKRFMYLWKYYVKKMGLINGLKFALIHKMRKPQIQLSLKGHKNPLIIRTGSSDIQVFQQIFINGDYDLNIDFQPKLIIDAGAYVGYSSVFFANKFPSARVIAIEPAKSNFDILLKNTFGYKNIISFNRGLWSKKTSLDVIDKGYGDWGFLVAEDDRCNVQRIQAITLDEILADSDFDSIDILKLDIEGSEKEIFKQNYENWLSKVNLMFIELHDRIISGCSEVFYRATKSFDFSYSVNGENIVLLKNNRK